MKKTKKETKAAFKRRIMKGANRGKKSTVVIMDKKAKMKHRRNNKGMFFADLTKEYCPQPWFEND